MRVIEHDPDRQPWTARPAGIRLHFDPFATVPLSRGAELRFDIATGPDRRSVSFRLFTLREDGEVKKQAAPIHLFGPYLDAVIATLMAARAAIGATPAPEMVQAVEQAGRAVEIGRQVDAATKGHARAVEIDRSVRAQARAIGIDPGGYVVLTPGSPEHARAERDLQRARAL